MQYSNAIEVSTGLHLKSIVNYVDRNTLLLNEEGTRHPAFASFEHIVLNKNTLATPCGSMTT